MSPGFLRVVDESDAWHRLPNPIRHNENGQLEFNLGDDQVRKILVAAMDRIHGLRLLELVQEVHPVVVLDLRNAIRFDLPGTSRHMFLESVARVRSMYMRVPMEWRANVHTFVQADLDLPSRLHHELIERGDGNVMLLVKNPEHALRISSMMNVTLSKFQTKHWDIQQVM